MTPKQRFQAALRMEIPDRIPLFYQHLGASSYLQKATGLVTKNGFDDPEVFAKLSLEAYRQFGFDNVMAGWGDILVEAQAHGTTWKFTDPRFYPRPDKYVPISKVGEISPVDPMQDKHWSVPLKAAKLMLAEVGEEVDVLGCIDSPTVIASEVVGMENLMMAYFQNPDLVHHLLRTLTESAKAYGEHVSNIGLEEVFLENGTAGEEMVSLEMYEGFDRKYLGQVVGSYHKLGLRTIIHNCSALPFYRSQVELHPSAIHIHLVAVDVPEMFSFVKGKTCMMAGIDHMNLLFKRTPDEVEAEVKRVIGLWGDAPGFILAPGCELPYKTPLDNIRRMKEATIRYGTYR